MRIKLGEAQCALRRGGYIDTETGKVYAYRDDPSEDRCVCALIDSGDEFVSDRFVPVPCLSTLSSAVDFIYSGNVEDDLLKLANLDMGAIKDYPVLVYLRKPERAAWDDSDISFAQKVGIILQDHYLYHEFRDFCDRREERIGVRWFSEHGIEIVV